MPILEADRPLPILITESGQEAIRLRAACRLALWQFRAITGALPQVDTRDIQDVLQGALGEATPERCSVCGADADILEDGLFYCSDCCDPRPLS